MVMIHCLLMRTILTTIKCTMYFTSTRQYPLCLSPLKLCLQFYFLGNTPFLYPCTLTFGAMRKIQLKFNFKLRKFNFKFNFNVKGGTLQTSSGQLLAIELTLNPGTGPPTNPGDRKCLRQYKGSLARDERTPSRAQTKCPTTLLRANGGRHTACRS